MSENKTSKEIMQGIYAYAIDLYQKKKKNAVEIKLILIEKGLPISEAELIARDVEEHVEHTLKAKGKTEIYIGLGLLVLGLLISLGTYNSAVSNGGGHYIVTYGLIIGGVTNIIRGVFKLT